MPCRKKPGQEAVTRGASRLGEATIAARMPWLHLSIANIIQIVMARLGDSYSPLDLCIISPDPLTCALVPAAILQAARHAV